MRIFSKMIQVSEKNIKSNVKSIATSQSFSTIIVNVLLNFSVWRGN